MTDTWSVAGRTFTSRLIVGTGKYKDFEQNAAAVAASGVDTMIDSSTFGDRRFSPRMLRTAPMTAIC